MSKLSNPVQHRDEYDDEGRLGGRIYGNDPNHPDNWRVEYDDEGRRVAVVFGNEPNDPRSWRDEYNAEGQCVACIYGNEPNNPRSWRDEEAHCVYAQVLDENGNPPPNPPCTLTTSFPCPHCGGNITTGMWSGGGGDAVEEAP